MTELEFTKLRLEEAIEAIDKLQAAQPVWCKDEPKEEGWYWYHDLDEPELGPDLCLVQHVLSCWTVMFTDGDEVVLDTLNGEWAKIPMPREA